MFLALLVEPVLFLAVMLLFDLMLSFFLTVGPLLFQLLVLLINLDFSFVAFSLLVLGIFFSFGFLRLMLLMTFVFLLIWSSPVLVMRFIPSWVDGPGSLIIVRIFEIFTRIDTPSVFVIVLIVGLLWVVVV